MLFGVVASSVYDEQKQQTMATTMRICKAQCNNTKQYSLIKKVKQEQVLVHKPASTSGRPISFFSYRPIPINADKSHFLIGRYR